MGVVIHADRSDTMELCRSGWPPLSLDGWGGIILFFHVFLVICALLFFVTNSCGYVGSELDGHFVLTCFYLSTLHSVAARVAGCRPPPPRNEIPYGSKICARNKEN